MFLGRFGTARALAAALLSALVITGCGGSTPPGPKPGNVTVTAIAPSSGTTFGGTTVTVTGTGFSAGATVQIGGTAATDVTITSSTTLTAKTPVHAAGNADVRVTVGTASGSLAGAFLFTAPAATVNTPPTVSPLTVQPPRARQPVMMATIGDRITLTASVNDAETPANQLTYEWAANPNLGTISGTGASVQWTAPASVSSAQSVLLTLTVIERYQVPDAQGLPLAREHRVQQAAIIKIHDSVKEIGDMAVDFLTQFSISSVGADVVLRNFSRTCDDGEGYRQELSDVLNHRRDYTMVSYTIGAPSVTFAFASRPTACAWPGAPGDACAKVPVIWTDRNKNTGVQNTVTGNDYVSAVYEDSRWFLCHSRWELLTSQNFHTFFHSVK